MASIQKTIMEAVRTSVVAVLAGRGYTDDNTRLRKLPSIIGLDDGKRCVISPSIERVTDQATNERDDVGYGVMITLANAGNGNPEYSDSFDELMNERKVLRKNFHDRPRDLQTILTAQTDKLPDGYMLSDLKVEPGPVLMASPQDNNIDATALIVRVFVRETRT